MAFKKILIVDDRKPSQFLTKLTIEAYDPAVEIIAAYHGQEALDYLDQTNEIPDIIFLDLNMPVMDGHEFLEVYSKKPYCRANIVVLSSSSLSVDRERVEAYDCVRAYIEKPVNIARMNELADILDAA